MGKAFSGGVVLFLILMLTVPLFLDDCGPGSSDGDGDGGNWSEGKGLNEDAVPKDWVEWLKKGGGICKEATPPLLAAQAEAESGFKDHPPNEAGAAGPMQFTEPTWASHGVDGDGDGKKDLHSVADSVVAAGKYDCTLLEAMKSAKSVKGDDTELMLAAYNAGPGRVIQYGGVPPFEETRNYIAKIKKATKKFTAEETKPIEEQTVEDDPVAGGTIAQNDTDAKVVMPVPKGTYRVSSRVGPRDTGIPGASTWHQGTDFAAAEGTPILAASAGTVQETGTASGFGQWIVQKSDIDGEILVYGHMRDSTKWVKPGDKVKAGQRIASVSNNGIGGFHLHFETWPGGKRTGKNSDVADSLIWLKDHNAEGLDKGDIPDGPKDDGDNDDKDNSCAADGDGGGSGELPDGADVTPPKRNPDGTWPDETCSETDPTQPKNDKACVTPRTATLMKKLKSMEVGDGMLCWDPHLQNPSSDHPKGKGCDITIGKLGKKPTGDKKAEGDKLAEWFVKNHKTWAVKYVIWDGKIWTESTQKWRDYGGGGAYDPGDVTGGHFDHNHVSLY